jgi:hypothetical protein
VLWKESSVVPLFKSGDKRNISKYREISFLFAIHKLFEKLVCDVVTPIIRPSISDEQHGFVGGRSTVTIVLWSFIILTDFSKAFDRVYHGLLFR